MTLSDEDVQRYLAAERVDRANGITSYVVKPDPEAWLEGESANPLAVPVDPIDPVPGWPFLLPGSAAVISGPTGGGRSSLVQACSYDAAKAGVTCAYLGHEVTCEEFHARTGVLAHVRGDRVDDGLIAALVPLRYLDLTDTIQRAWDDPEAWVVGITTRYQVVVIDPLSAVDSALDLNFDQVNREFVAFYDRLVQPIVAQGVAVALLDNVGHEAKDRAKGVSAKRDKPDLEFVCKRAGQGLVVKAGKVRSARAPFRRGDEWMFGRESQRVQVHTPLQDAGGSSDPWRPTIYMARVSATLSRASGPLSVNAIRRETTGKTEHIDAAIRALEADGFVRREQQGLRLRRAYRDPSATTPATPHDPGATPTATSAAPPATPGLQKPGQGRGQGRDRTFPSSAASDDLDAELNRIRAECSEDFA